MIFSFLEVDQTAKSGAEAAKALDDITNGDIDKIGKFVEKLSEWAVGMGGKILVCILIYIIGRFIISIIKKVVNKLLTARDVDASVASFIKSFVSVILYLLLIVAIVSKLGIETTSIAALLASFGVAIGMALSGNMQNFAGGLIMLFLKPFKVDDYIECQGVQGTVQGMQIFHTILKTPENKVIYVPNGALSSGTITNYTKQDIRRLDWVFGVEYGQDFAKAEKVIMQVINGDERIKKDPAPYVAIDSLADSSVNILVRVWAANEDWWDVHFDMNKKVYEAFNKEGIEFPFPQITVHKAED